MIWTIRVKIGEGENQWVRVIEFDSETTLLNLHEEIQFEIDFDNDHMFEFYVGKNPGNRAFPVGGDIDWSTFDPFKIYKKIRIKDVWPLPTGMKLFYLFDFGDCWLFQITKTRHKAKKPDPGMSYPRLVEAGGKNPEQY
jgi:hypothetical protein